MVHWETDVKHSYPVAFNLGKFESVILKDISKKNTKIISQKNWIPPPKWLGLKFYVKFMFLFTENEYMTKW